MRLRSARRLPVILTLGVGLLGAPLAAGANDAAVSGGKVEVIARGLNSPRGLAFGANHNLYVAEAGKGGPGPCAPHPILGEACVGRTGSVTKVRFGHQRRVVTGLSSIIGTGGEALGPHDVAPTGSGALYITVGLAGGGPDLRAQFGPEGRGLGRLVRADADGSRRSVANLAGFEARVNPAGGTVDSNPFGVLKDGKRKLVADAGGNAVVAVRRPGHVRTVAVFPERLVEFGGGEIPMQAVPTTVVRGPDGAYYVGQLTGFPFPIGGARVYRVVPGQRPEIYRRGFTNIIDIAFGDDGSLYVLEIAHNSLLSPSPEGALIRVGPGGRRSIVADGLFFPGGVEIGSRGKLFVTDCGICTGAGKVLRITP